MELEVPLLGLPYVYLTHKLVTKSPKPVGGSSC